MVSFALAFVLGAFCLQQMPVLPSLYWIALLVILAAFFAIANYKPQPSTLPLLRFLQRLLLMAYVFFLGFFWAATWASVRLADELPHAWENKPITLVGVVASVPELTERGERFRFNVEKVLTPAAVVPRHISLSYYPPDSWGKPQPLLAPQPAQFKAGERWHLLVRLKRPHGTQNPHGFDFESWTLAEGIRATGSIKAKANNHKLSSFVWQP